MHSRFLKLFLIIFIVNIFSSLHADMTVEELFFDNTKPYHLKILDVLPKEAIIQIGNDNSKNTIIEFMDYFCGYCKKIHPELVELAKEREDVRVIFLQHPILNESSFLIAKMVLAANFQGKGLELHHTIFSTPGSLTKEKLEQAIKKSGLNEVKLRVDIKKDEVSNIISLSSFLAGGSGARGTPSIFINENFFAGYIPKERILSFLK